MPWQLPHASLDGRGRVHTPDEMRWHALFEHVWFSRLEARPPSSIGTVTSVVPLSWPGLSTASGTG
jgi:hypothetical protein